MIGLSAVLPLNRLPPHFRAAIDGVFLMVKAMLPKFDNRTPQSGSGPELDSDVVLSPLPRGETSFHHRRGVPTMGQACQ
jgi:hypothetical protein